MIQSMTGFGRCVRQLSDKAITVEIKSLNSKSLDFNLRLPSYYREKELALRNMIQQMLERGKVDLTVYIENLGSMAPAELNETLVNQYIGQLQKIVDGDKTELLKMAVRMPDALQTRKEEADAVEWEEVETAVREAVRQLIDFRASEGKVLYEEFKLRIVNIQLLLEKIPGFELERVEMVKDRLHKAIIALKETVDENRFEQELIYYLEKYDIAEEKLRLSNHLSYFLENLGSADSNGKKLGFIAQELGREINTIGSKANHAGMQQLVVQMKDELEKLKEQLLNAL